MAHAKMIDMAGHIMLGFATLTPTYHYLVNKLGNYDKRRTPTSRLLPLID